MGILTIPFSYGNREYGRATSLRGNFAWTFAGNVVYSACQWGVLVLLAKLGSPEMVGQFALGLAVATPAIMFANLQLRSVLATDVLGRHRFGDYLGFRLITTTAALLIVLGILFAAGHRSDTAAVIFMVAVAQAIEAIADVYYGLFQLHEQMDRIAISMIARGPLSLVLMGALIWFTGSVFWGVVGLAVGRAAVLVCYDLRTSTTLGPAAATSAGFMGGIAGVSDDRRPHWALGLYGQLFRVALPLGIVSLLVSLNTNIPRYFIQASLGERQLGIFSAIAFLLSSGNLVVGALGQSAFVRLAKYYAGGELADFRSLLTKLLGLGLVLGVGGILLAQFAGRQILTILYRPEYAQESGVLVWLMVAGAIGYLGQFVGYAMTAARYFKSQVPLFVLVALAATLSSSLLVPAKGLFGAILAFLITMMVQLTGSLVILLRGMNRWPVAKVETAAQL